MKTMCIHLLNKVFPISKVEKIYRVYKKGNLYSLISKSSISVCLKDDKICSSEKEVSGSKAPSI